MTSRITCRITSPLLFPRCLEPLSSGAGDVVPSTDDDVPPQADTDSVEVLLVHSCCAKVGGLE